MVGRSGHTRKAVTVAKNNDAAATGEKSRAPWPAILHFVFAVILTAMLGSWALPVAAASIPAAVTINFDGLGFADNADYGSKTFTSGDFSITSSGPNWTTLSTTSGVCQSNSSGCLAVINGQGVTETVTIQTTSGNEFKFTSFWMQNLGGGNIVKVEGYLNGGASPVATQTTGFPVDGGAATVTLNSGFQNVDKVVITSNPSGFNDVFDTFVFNTAILPAPSATTGAATAISATGATLNGTINDNGAATTVTFDYGTTIGYGTNVSATTGGTVSAGAGATATAVSLTGLACNTTYHFRVKGVNSSGTTNGSDATFTTSKCPQTITFSNPGAQNFGTTPTLTATSNSGLTVTFSSSTTGVCTITSGGALTFVTAGTCTVNADQAGDASYAVATTVSQSFSVNAVVPGAPGIGTATAGDTQASVAFTAPASSGGATITGYTVIASPGGFTGSGASSPIVVTGLANGTAYTFTVTATNSAGTGAASTASTAVTPKASQTITFSNPGAQNFGTTPTLTATATSALTPTFTSSTTGVCTITSGGALTFVTAGTCTINADQAGNGSYLAAPQVSRSFTVSAVVPGAPTIGTATAGDTQASVAFTAPATSGGAAITGYTVTASPGGFTGTGASSPIVVTGLGNGTAYTFTVTATNSAGTGAASSASNAVTPKASQTITFPNPGAQNFGTTPTLSATATSGLTPTFTSSTTGVCTITSGGALTFVTTGTCTINADQAGNASYLAASQVSRTFTVNPVVPGAPTSPLATAGNTQASVAFTAPSFSGGTAITGYTVTASPGGFTGSGAASPIVVTGLTNGTAYTFTVTATNMAGTGSASVASNAVTPAGNQTITFSNPGAQNFGTTPTLTATATSGLTPTFTSSTSGVCTITSGGVLTFVTAGTCTIKADQAGNGSYTAAATVTQSFTVNAVIPGAPVIGAATAGNTQASVAFTAPAATGGAAITGYTVTASPGGATATGSASPIIVTGLTNGTAYTFTVTATNPAGTGGASAASSSVTPVAVPGAPTIGTATAGNGQASVTFTAPAVTGGSAITGYTVTSAPGGFTGTGASSPIIVAGLANGTAYTFTVKATNAIGSSVASAASNSVTPAVGPGAPTAVTATAGDKQATVSFVAPASNGGSAITTYTALASPGGQTGSCAGPAACAITVTGLTNGATYTFTVTATNIAGTGTPSAPSSPVSFSAIPTAAAATMTTPYNTPVTLDLAPFINGVGTTGINVVVAAQHGTTKVSGTQVTYTPANDYFGPDTFSYVAVSASGNSAAAVVTVSVTGRPDPAKNANVTGIVNSQKEIARNFWRAQISNFHQRMESRHRMPRSDADASDGAKPRFNARNEDRSRGTNFSQINALTARDAQVKNLEAIPAGNAESPRLAAAFASAIFSQINRQPTNLAQLNAAPPAMGVDRAMPQPASASLQGLLASVLVPDGVTVESFGQTPSVININLAALTGSKKKTDPNASEGNEVWTAGSVRIGSKDATANSDKMDFTTQGVSVGIDRRFGENLTLGMGFGYGHDKTTIGTDGTRNNADGNSVVVYGSYQMGANFIDALLGYGELDMDAKRFVAVANDFAFSKRKGSQIFASLATGIEYRDGDALWSPYARYDYAVDRLKEATETGAGLNALSYSTQSRQSHQISLGLRGELEIETGFGWMVPRARAEYQHQIDRSNQASIAYADLKGVQYALTSPTINSNSVLLGLGSRVMWRNNLMFDFDYQWLRSSMHERSQAILLRLSYSWR